MTEAEPLALPHAGGASHSMLEVWRLAITGPNELTYVSLAEDPRAGVGRAAAWTAAAALVTTLIGLAGQWLYGGIGRALAVLQESAPSADLTAFSSAGLAMALCLVPLAAASSVLGLIVTAGLLQFIAGAFGGEGTFGKLAFTLAAYSAPMSIISALLTLVPLVGLCLGLPLGIYGLALNLLAIKAVNRFSWGRAAATLALFFVLVVMVCLVLGLLLLRAIPPELLQDWPLT